MCRYCVNCGNKLDEEDAFCSKCGTKARDFKQEESTEINNEVFKKPINSIKIFFITFIAALAVVGIVAAAVTIFSGEYSADKKYNKAEAEQLEAEQAEEYSNASNMSLADYVKRYNDALRKSVDSVKVTYGVPDDEYISCAKTLVNSKLNNPSSANYNSSSIYEKDDYGKAIVKLDVSAQNALGGWVRKVYYVCILSVNDDGKFQYSSTMPYVDNESMSLYDTFKRINNFGEHPADKHLENFLVREDDFSFSKTINRNENEFLDVYRCSTSIATHNVYVDTETDKIVAIQLSFSNAFYGEDEQKVCNAMYATIIDKDMSLQIDKFTNGTAFEIYEKGVVCDCSVSENNANVSATATKKDSYESGDYWTPNKMTPSQSNTESSQDTSMTSTINSDTFLEQVKGFWGCEDSDGTFEILSFEGRIINEYAYAGHIWMKDGSIDKLENISDSEIKATISYMEIAYGEEEAPTEKTVVEYIFRTNDNFENSLTVQIGESVYDYIYLGDTEEKVDEYAQSKGWKFW